MRPDPIHSAHEEPMKNPHPTRQNTRVRLKFNEWLPTSFDDFVAELEALKRTAEASSSLLVFRGQCRREWRLDSTFARSVKALLFGMKPEESYSARLRESGELNFALTSLLLLKYGTLLEPSAELLQAEVDHGVDAWFELLKRHQQYPNEDAPVLQGTNFLDWSRSSDIALYFANEGREGAGALFVCDATSTGKTLQTAPVLAILHKVREQLTQGQSNGAPLLFSPPKQILNQRAKNQQAVYFAQMELRVDLSELWRLVEDRSGEKILVKLVLPAATESSVANYLSAKRIDRSFIYPDMAKE